ncbi:MAG: PD-(D/E)XK nuclease family protein [Sandaracinaceae bacterium]|nr:PD-(D/E)XK nuclease family protein [Sandaracinaceae bacterium]
MRTARGSPAITLLHFVGTPELRADLVRAALGERIAREIARLLDPRVQIVSEHGSRALSPADIHVLCRSRGDAEDVGEALAAARIPHAFYKQEGLFQTSAARDVFVLLRAIEDPDERVRRLDAWLTPFFAVPLERLDECRDLPPDHPLIALLGRWHALAEAQEWTALFRAVLEESGAMRRELFAGASERRLTDYQHILEVLLDETHRGHRSLPQLVNRLSAFIEGRESPLGESGNVHRLESERKAVQILTMHKSKGLEAEVVFLAGGLSEPGGDRLEPHVFHDEAGRRVAWIGDPPPEVKERLAREKREEAERLLYVAMTRARSALYVPYFGPPPPGAPLRAGASYELTVAPERSEEPRAQLSLLFEDPEVARADAEAEADDEHEYELERLNGPYRVLNDRLVALAAAGAVDGELLARVEIPVVPRAAPAADLRVTLSPFRPPPELLAAERDRRGALLASRARARGRGRHELHADEDRARRLPGARGDGRAARAVRHRVRRRGAALDGVGGAPGRDGGRRVLARGARAPRLRARGLGRGRRRAARASRGARAAPRARPRQRGGGGAPRPGGRAPRARAPRAGHAGGRRDAGGRARARGASGARAPFLHPIPERAHPTLADPPPGPDRPPLAIERGYIRGVIDLVIEHAGRYHVLDYKSDRLPSYEAAAVRAHVERNYLVQARLYALGTLRALSIHDRAAYEARFGGLLYAFLRGMASPSEGVYTLRPSWDEVLAWERALHDDAPWGYALPPRRALAS